MYESSLVFMAKEKLNSECNPHHDMTESNATNFELNSTKTENNWKTL